MDLWIVNEPKGLPSRTSYALAKRLMDVSLCLLLLPIAVPVAALCALAIYLESGLPILFIQKRVGRGGGLFGILKFRTMRADLDDSQHRAFMRAFVQGKISPDGPGPKIYKPFRASDVTRVGSILRKTSMDELPQLVNVLHGEMSLVGPRPNVPWEVEKYHLWHHERLEVLPGITGLAQVRGRSGLTFRTIVRHDVEYVRNASLLFDLQILYWTVRSIVLGQGAQ